MRYVCVCPSNEDAMHQKQSKALRIESHRPEGDSKLVNEESPAARRIRWRTGLLNHMKKNERRKEGRSKTNWWMNRGVGPCGQKKNDILHRRVDK